MKINDTELCEALITDMYDVCEELKKSSNPDDYQLGRWLETLTDIDCKESVLEAQPAESYEEDYDALSYAVRGWYNELDEVVDYLTTTVGRINKKTVISTIKAIMTDINNYV